jgi:hypothetical protein
MKPTAISILALFVSLLSLGSQLKGPKSTAYFDKFLVPAKVSDFQHRMDLANLDAVRERQDYTMWNGIGTPLVVGLTDDHKKIIVRPTVVESELPKEHEGLRTALYSVAYSAQGSVARNFDLTTDEASHVVIVQFWRMGNPQHAKDWSPIYAEFADGELTFH